MYDDDLIGWDLDDVLEGFDGDGAADGIAIDSCGEPRNPLLDAHARDALDVSDVLDADLAIDSDGNLTPAELRLARVAPRKRRAA